MEIPFLEMTFPAFRIATFVYKRVHPLFQKCIDQVHLSCTSPTFSASSSMIIPHLGRPKFRISTSFRQSQQISAIHIYSLKSSYFHPIGFPSHQGPWQPWHMLPRPRTSSTCAKEKLWIFLGFNTFQVLEGCLARCLLIFVHVFLKLYINWENGLLKCKCFPEIADQLGE